MSRHVGARSATGRGKELRWLPWLLLILLVLLIAAAALVIINVADDNDAGALAGRRTPASAVYAAPADAA